MKKTVLLVTLLTGFLFADVVMTKTPPRKGPVILPVPPEHPVRPVRPVAVQPAVVYQDNYYNTTVHEECAELRKIIEEKDQEIQSLWDEIDRLRAKEQERLQKSLKAKHEAELKKFEERKPSVNSQNSISITEKKQ